MYDMVPDSDTRLEDLRTKTDYMKKKREILSELQWPTDPFDKQNLSITISAKDIMDIPEARQKILESIWINVSQQEPQIPQQEQQNTQEIQTQQNTIEPIWRWIQIQ